MPAVAALGALDAVAIALVALIFAYALWQLFSPFLTSGLGQVPVVGSFIRTAADTLLWTVWSAVGGWVGPASQPIADLIARTYWLVGLWTGYVTEGMEATYLAIGNLKWAVIPNAVQFLEVAINGVAVWAEQQLQASVTWLEVVINGVAVWSAQLAYNYYQSALAELSSSVLWLEGVINGVAVWSEQVAQNYYQAAISEAQRLYASAIGYADSWGSSLEGQIEAEAQVARDYADQWGRALDGEIRSGLAAEQEYARALTAAQGAVLGLEIGAVSTALEQLLQRDCIRFCNPVGGLGSILQDLEDIGLEALLLALVGEAVSNPQAVLEDVSSIVAPIVQDIGQGVTAMAGLGTRAA